MNPMMQFCHNLDCPARGQLSQGNITIHSQKEQRYRCKTCGTTFAATTGTPFYRLRLAADLVTVVLILLSHGCPTQAIVAAFGLDERTIAAWVQRAGQHAQQVHQHLVQQGQIDLQHVQADELWVKLVGRRVWQAMAIAVPSRVWLGGGISPQRDRADPSRGAAGAGECRELSDLGLCGWLGQLRGRLSCGVSAAGADWQARASALGS
jgi:transposase-like protein